MTSWRCCELSTIMQELKDWQKFRVDSHCEYNPEKKLPLYWEKNLHEYPIELSKMHEGEVSAQTCHLNHIRGRMWIIPVFWLAALRLFLCAHPQRVQWLNMRGRIMVWNTNQGVFFLHPWLCLVSQGELKGKSFKRCCNSLPRERQILVLSPVPTQITYTEWVMNNHTSIW